MRVQSVVVIRCVPPASVFFESPPAGAENDVPCFEPGVTEHVNLGELGNVIT